MTEVNLSDCFPGVMTRAVHHFRHMCSLLPLLPSVYRVKSSVFILHCVYKEQCIEECIMFVDDIIIMRSHHFLCINDLFNFLTVIHIINYVRMTLVQR